MTHADVPGTPATERSETRGIFDGFSGYVTPTMEDWQNVLSNGMVVVDTNVLLNLYRYNQDARASLLDALEKLGVRLWVPNQVMVEFWRNRENALEDPERQLQQSISALRSDLEKATADLRSWINRVSLDRSAALQLEGTLDNAFDEVIGSMERVVDSSGLGMEHDTTKDKVLSALTVLLDGKVGAPLDPGIHSKCVADGKRRLDEQVPPGYKDKKKEARGDDSEVGDYLVWFQVMQEAKNRSTDVLLVTGDTKEDWWRLRNRMTLGPRNELSEELLREAGVHLYMLKPDRLLVLARDFLKVSVSEDSVQNVELVDAQSTSPDESVGSWSYASLMPVLRKLRLQAPVQEATIARAVENGGYVSREEIYEIGGYGPERMLKGFTRPVTRISLEVAADRDLSRFDRDLLDPVYAEMKAGFGWVDGFRVDSSLHAALRKAWALIDEVDVEDLMDEPDYDPGASS
ncbi:PIN-like domain-containing protein [Streptomyces sp. NPDC101237]|uniref:PIN-like domain-containing protein n=1 Tax=Streptomyces sp. NPDC101237 TaxID=3366139 RepID=UPI00380FA38A